MKARFAIIVLSVAMAAACTPNTHQDRDFSNYTVDRVVCQASSNFLVADNVSELDLNVEIYTRSGSYTDIYGQQRDLYTVIPRERWRNHDIKFYVNGSQVTPPYKTSSANPSTLQCYAEVDGVRSGQSPAKLATLYPRLPNGSTPKTDPAPEYPADPDPLLFEVTVREPFNMEPRRIPIVFHVIDLKDNYERGQSIQTSAIHELVENMNEIFGRRYSTAPNGANPNIEFVPALTKPNGDRLEDAGVNRILLADNDAKDYAAQRLMWIWNVDKTDEGLAMNQERYEALAAEGKLPVRTPRAFWDPDRYLNVWLCYDYGSPEYSGLVRSFFPMIYPEGVFDPQAIPVPDGWENGNRILTPDEIEMWKKNPGDLRLFEGALADRDFGLGRAGLYCSIRSVTNYDVTLIRQMGVFLGLIPNGLRSYSWDYHSVPFLGKNAMWLDDMCDDTPQHDRWYMEYKSGGIESEDTGSDRVKYTRQAPYYTYRSSNIMEVGSPCTVITQDQARRIEWVLRNAPGRQMWRNLSAIEK